MREHNLSFCKTPKNKIDANRFILSTGIICAFCKTVLQTVLSAETICKIVLLKIRKAQNMTVLRIY